MSYINDYIAQCPAFGWEGGPEFSTQIVSLANGHERRNAQWAQVRHKYSIPFQNLTDAEYAGIKQMHLACRGRLHAFRFRDALDHSVVAQPFAVGDGVKTQYQLITTSEVAGVKYTREIFAIARANVYVNGVDTTTSGDPLRGVVTFSAPPAPGAILTWTGEFDVWVRFDSDYLPFSIDNRMGQGYAINGSVNLLEVSPPGWGE